jgi:hypothetical protein
MDMDRPHIEKTTRYYMYNQTCSVFEPTGYKKKSNAKEYTEKRLGNGWE